MGILKNIHLMQLNTLCSPETIKKNSLNFFQNKMKWNLQLIINFNVIIINKIQIKLLKV